MKRCNRFGAFFAATLFTQAAFVVGSFSPASAHAGVLCSQTEIEAIVLGDQSNTHMIADCTDTVRLTLDADACRVDRTYDGDPIVEESNGGENNSDAAATAPAVNDAANDDNCDYLRYKYGHIDGFYGERNDATSDRGSDAAANDTSSDSQNADDSDEKRNTEAATEDSAADAKALADDQTSDEKVADDEDDNKAARDNVAEDKVAEEENGADNKVSDDNVTGDKVADAKSTDDENVASDGKTASDTGAEEEECNRYKYDHVYGRNTATEDQSATADAKPAGDDAPASEGYSAEKTEEAYGRDYQADGDRGADSQADQSKDDSANTDDGDNNDDANGDNVNGDNVNDDAFYGNSSNSGGCLAVCDALVAVFNGAASQVSTEIKVSYFVVSQLQAFGAAK